MCVLCVIQREIMCSHVGKVHCSGLLDQAEDYDECHKWTGKAAGQGQCCRLYGCGGASVNVMLAI